MTSLAACHDAIMARNRWQTQGYLRQHHGSWLLSWNEYSVDADGKPQRQKRSETLGKALGPDRITKKRAEELRDQKLAEINGRNQKPSTSMSVRVFAEGRFQTGYVASCKPSGQKHYGYCLRKLLAHIGDLRLCDVTPDHIAAVCASLRHDGYADETVKKIRDAAGALFGYAKDLRLYREENPARAVHLAEPVRTKRPTYTVAQVQLILSMLRSPYRELARCAFITSACAAELTGLKESRLNLTDRPADMDGFLLAPRSMAILENRYEGKQGTLKTGQRRRIIALDDATVEMLAGVLRRNSNRGPDAHVFQGKQGWPINAKNATCRVLAPLSEVVGFPVGWHAFRRAHSSAVGRVAGVRLEDRVKTMGHADAAMTLYYSVEEVESRRYISDGLAAMLDGCEVTKGAVN